MKLADHFKLSTLSVIALLGGIAAPARALDGSTLYVTPRNGWAGFEIITRGNDVPGDGNTFAMPGTFDGLGAQRIGDSALRIQVNHEIGGGGASISEVLVNLPAFQTALTNTIQNGNTGGVSFVTSAKQAYNRWTNNGGTTWNATSSAATTAFQRFCSGQSYGPNTYGPGRGFVDEVYITGEESGTSGRIFALDVNNADFYQVSSYAGSAIGTGGLGGMPTDAWENAALIDTGETNHVALVLSPDGGSRQMKLYIGEKGRAVDGSASNDFLARNGLAYGSYYYLNDTLPSTLGTTSVDGFFDNTAVGSLASSKIEDVDTSPTNPDRVVLGDQNSGLFTFDFDLDFSAGGFDAAGSSFSLTKIGNHASGAGLFGHPDNVEWSAATNLDGMDHPEGLIFVNEDNGTGEVWMMNPDGSNKTIIGDTLDFASATESSGILDISELLGYKPGSILLTDNQGSTSSLSVLINPDAELVPEPTSIASLLAGGLLLMRRRRG